MSKCGSYALLFGLSLIGFSIGFSDSANASIPANDNVTTVDELYLQAPPTSQDWGCSSGEKIDLSNSWFSFVTDPDNFTFSSSGGFDLNRGAYDNFVDDITANINSPEGSGWAVQQLTNDNNTVRGSSLNGHEGNGVRIYTFDPTSDLIMLPNGNIEADNLKSIDFTFNQNSAQCNIIFETKGAGLGIYNRFGGSIVDNTIRTESIFLLAGDVVYHPEYTGPTIPGSSVDEREVIRPDFKYTVVDKQLSLSDHNQALPEFVPEDGYNMVEYLVEWTVIRCDGHDPDEDFEQQGLCTGSTYIDSERLPQSDTFEYTVAEYGNYQLRAQYLVEMCYRYPSYPTTPDHCFYVEVGTQYEAYIWGETTKNVTIDGRTILGDTALESCDEFHICTRPSQDSVLSEYFQDKNASGLMMFLQAPIVFYQSLPAMTQTCSPITVPFLGGRTFELECLRPRYQQLSPFIYTMFQTVVNGVVAYAVATKIFARIKNVNDPENDRIEVARL